MGLPWIRLDTTTFDHPKMLSLMDAGHLKRVKIGRRAMITRASCDQYLASLVDGVQ